MAIKRISVHCVKIEDKPGSLQKLLSKISSSKVDLEGFIACGSCGSEGCVCLIPKKPSAFKECAQKCGIASMAMTGFVIGGEDKVGAAAEALKGLSKADINGVAGSAMVYDGRYQMLIVVDAADGDAAAKALGA